MTISLSIDLPFLGCYGSTSNFILRDAFDGYSGLLDARAGLAVFSRSVSNETPLVRDMCTGSVVYFGASGATQMVGALLATDCTPYTDRVFKQPQRLLSACILKEYIMLLGPWSIEVYPITEIRSRMRDGHQDILPKAVHPSQSLMYPGGAMANHVAVLGRSSNLSELSSRNGDSELSLGIFVRRETSWIRLHIQLGSESSSTPFASSIEPLFDTMGFRTIACCWGESGQQVLLASVYGASIRVRCGVAPSPPLVNPSFEDSAPFRWSLVLDGENDLFTGFTFDEASCICAAATSSGRIWIDDFSKSPSAYKCSEESQIKTKVCCGYLHGTMV